jgi:hypothetical protein
MGYRNRYDDYDDDVPSRRGGSGSTVTTILLIVGGVLAVLCLVSATVVGLIAYAGFRVVDEVQKELNAGRVPAGVGKVIFTHQGQLAVNDPVKNFRPHKGFEVNMEKGKTYVIDLESNDFDSFLHLYGPDGVQVAEDDDGGDGLNSRIRYAPTQTGKHTIAASELVTRAGGRFTVTVREEP